MSKEDMSLGELCRAIISETSNTVLDFVSSMGQTKDEKPDTIQHVSCDLSGVRRLFDKEYSLPDYSIVETGTMHNLSWKLYQIFKGSLDEF